MIIRTVGGEEYLDKDLLSSVASYIAALEECIGSGKYASFDLDSSYMTVTFCDEETIQEVNREQRDIDKVTDVLSFPFLDVREGRLLTADLDYEYDESGNQSVCLGDVLICVPKALTQAEEYGHSAVREILFLTVHSFLHLIGFDHMNDEDEKVMTDRQKRIMVDIGLANDEEREYVANAGDLPENTVIPFEGAEGEPEFPAGSPCMHCGYAALLGRPNSGKSTLINYITGMKVAIVSHKPQTTRTRILSIYNTEDSQIIFVDTPGVHKPESLMGEIMVDKSFKSASSADVFVLMADGRFATPGNVEKDIIARCRENNKKVILAINKSDEVAGNGILPVIAAYSSLYDFTDIIPISAKTGDNVEELLKIIASNLPSGPRLYDSLYMTDQTEREIASELIREQLLHFTNQEIPHGVAVEITKFDERYMDGPADPDSDLRDLVVIEASVICDRDSHKSIIIGKNGRMIKKIGTSARINIERMLGCKVYLELFVKVRSEWKNNETYLKDFGLGADKED